MAAHTASGAYATAPIRRVEKGMFVVDSGQHAFGATTFSTSDTLHAVRFAQGVTIWGWHVKFHAVEAAASILVRIGATDLSTTLTQSLSVTTWFSSAAMGAEVLNRPFGINLPFKVSLSDDAANLWQYGLIVRLAGTITTSDLVRVWFDCSMDETHAV